MREPLAYPMRCATPILDSSATLSLVVHVPLFILTAALAWRLPSGHPLAFRPATISQLFGVVFAYASTPPFSELQPFVPLVIAVQAAVLVLLWVPPASRAFFADHPMSSRSRKRAPLRDSRGMSQADPERPASPPTMDGTIS